MGDPKQTLWQEMTQGLGKFFVYAAYILGGVVGKIALDSKTGVLTRRQIIYKTALSIFVGALAAGICENLHYETWSKVIVPVATLMGEGIVGYAMANWDKILVNWLPAWAQKVFKKKP